MSNARLFTSVFEKCMAISIEDDKEVLENKLRCFNLNCKSTSLTDFLAL